MVTSTALCLLPSPAEFCHTPKHGNWLNVAENELSALTRQWIRGRRIPTLAKLQAEIAAWSIDVNQTQRGVDWQMGIEDARTQAQERLS